MAGRALPWMLVAAALLGAGCERQDAVRRPGEVTGAAGPAASAPAAAAPAVPPDPLGPQPTATLGGPPTPEPVETANATSDALPAGVDPGDATGAGLLAQRRLVVPVRGVAPSALTDTWDARRAAGAHEALDIVAPAGTPVVAVDDGTIAKLFTSKAGGLTVYQFDVREQLAYYYAHLEAYAPGLREGMAVKRGQVLGTVGSTGNADPRTPHLHFSVFALGPDKRWWEGEAVNPFPALRRAQPASLREETLARR